jgi:hypothetical protein
MNPLSGYIELDLNGEILPFKFGTNAWSLFCEKHSLEFHQIASSGVFGKVTGKDESGKDIISAPDVFALADLYYFAYVSAIRAKKEIQKINFEQFIELLDETPGAMVELQKVMLQAKVLGYTLFELAATEGKAENFPNP